MQIAVLGINHKQGNVGSRESFAKAFLRHFSMAQNLKNVVLLLTCNRAEIYFGGDGKNLADLHQYILGELRREMPFEFEQKCYSFFGYDCFLHLAQVTSGLDSAILQETEIQGQVKQAYESAKTTTTLSSELHFLFQKCLRIGKIIRSSCFDAKKSPSCLEEIILHTAKRHFQERYPAPLFVGASEINLKIARFLKAHGVANLHFCNRTLVKAEEIATELQGTALPWSDLQARWSTFDWVISAVSHPAPLFLPARELSHHRLLIDLAVPRNIHPEVPGHLYNIDDLSREMQSRRELLDASVQEAHRRIVAMIEPLIVRFKERTEVASNFAHI